MWEKTLVVLEFSEENLNFMALYPSQYQDYSVKPGFSGGLFLPILEFSGGLSLPVSWFFDSLSLPTSELSDKVRVFRRFIPPNIRVFRRCTFTWGTFSYALRPPLCDFTVHLKGLSYEINNMFFTFKNFVNTLLWPMMI